MFFAPQRENKLTKAIINGIYNKEITIVSAFKSLNKLFEL